MDYLDLLRRLDDRQHWEFPKDFDYDAAVARFARFVDALSIALGQPLRTESGYAIQDASFHSQVFVPLGEKWFTSMRFSNFGNMVTIRDDEATPRVLKTMVNDLLKKHGYVYVPSHVLRQKYPGDEWVPNWWTRYFDHL
jgi:hypothetical protein